MRGHAKTLIASVAVATLLSAASALAQPVDTARIAGGDPNDWLAYHQSYNGWSYSPLDQINANNVKDLEVAWITVPGIRPAACSRCRWPRTACCITSAPTAGCSRWTAQPASAVVYFPELDDELVARQTHSPYNRGMAMGEGKALHRHRRWPADRARHEDRQAGLGHQADQFPEADRRLYRRAALRQGHGGHRQPGRRMARSRPDLRRRRRDRQEKWEFDTVGRHREAEEDLGQRSWRTGGGGGWMPGTYDAETNRCGGAPPTRRRSTTGPARTGEDRAAAGRQPLHLVGDRARSRHRQAQILPPGTAARHLGLRQRDRRVRARSIATASSTTCIRTRAAYIFVYDRAKPRSRTSGSSSRPPTSSKASTRKPAS